MVDFESISLHRLTIQVTDESGPSLIRSNIAEVLIRVINVNEFAPILQPYQTVRDFLTSVF